MGDLTFTSPARQLERVMGIEPTSSAWKAEVLPLNYTRRVRRWVPNLPTKGSQFISGGGGRIRTFVGVKPADLQSALVGRLSTPPRTKPGIVLYFADLCQPERPAKRIKLTGFGIPGAAGSRTKAPGVTRRPSIIHTLYSQVLAPIGLDGLDRGGRQRTEGDGFSHALAALETPQEKARDRLIRGLGSFCAQDLPGAA
jgi:hypothetical protein